MVVADQISVHSFPGLGRFGGEGIGYPHQYSWASLVAQLVKNLSAMWEAWVRSLGWEDSPGEGKGYSLQYSGLEHSTDYTVLGVAKSQTGLSDFYTHPLLSTMRRWAGSLSPHT